MRPFYKLFFACLLGVSIYALTHARPFVEIQERNAVIAFYNVENLFDTIDDPLKKDDEFLPGTEKNWSSERYTDKLDRISEVLAGINSESLPSIVGLCEVENIGVLEDLVKHPRLAKAKYVPILIEGKDQRGIDVAMLVAKKAFKVISTSSYHVDLGEENRPTRDILHVRGKVKKGPTLNIFINHWPSRYGGAEKSEPKRLAAAEVLKAKTDSIASLYPDEGIICMGDFNDYPENKSLSEVLVSDGSTLTNLMDGLKDSKRGSYNYRGNWGFLDQIIVSNNLLNSELPLIVKSSTAPFYTDSMLYVHPEYGDTKPSRTYGGSNYYGGYSDHLPVYTVLAY